MQREKHFTARSETSLENSAQNQHKSLSLKTQLRNFFKKKGKKIYFGAMEQTPTGSEPEKQYTGR